jgi:hypothetical protein
MTMTRQPPFRPGEAVVLRLEEAPWFVPATFVAEVRPPGDSARVVYRVRRLDSGGLVQDLPLYVHRDGSVLQDWMNAQEDRRSAGAIFRAQIRASGLGEGAFGHERYLHPETTSAAGRALPGYAAWAAAVARTMAAAALVLAVHPDPEGIGTDQTFERNS